MKKLIVTGMVLLSTSFASAGGGVAKGPRELITDYKTKLNNTYFGEGKTAASLQESTLDTVKKTLVYHLGMPDLQRALNGSSGTRHLENVIVIFAAKKLATEEPSLKGTEEGASIERAANATGKIISNSAYIGEKKSTTLKASEVTLVRGALERLEQLPTDILIKFSKAERDSYSAVVEKYDELNTSGSKNSAEDNFVQAIMDVKGVSKEKALEIVKKLKECV